MWNAFIDDQMAHNATFSLALSEFETKAKALKLKDDVKLHQLRTCKKNNKGKRQFLPDRLLDDLKHTERNHMGYEATVNHLTGADNGMHISDPELANSKKNDSRGSSIHRVLDPTLVCHNCNNTGHVATGCKSAWCGFCNRFECGHRWDTCPTRTSQSHSARGPHKHNPDGRERGSHDDTAHRGRGRGRGRGRWGRGRGRERESTPPEDDERQGHRPKPKQVRIDAVEQHEDDDDEWDDEDDGNGIGRV